MTPSDDDPGLPRVGMPTRWAMVVLAFAMVVVLLLARWLVPDPKGLGTHTQLGLPPCPFYRVTGHPCPSCGMTTSFAWFVRLRPSRSFAANPAGAVLAPCCVVLVPWLLAGAALGRTPGFRTVEDPLIGVVVLTVGVSLVTWTVRLFL